MRDRAPNTSPAPWARIFIWALAGTVLVSLAVLVDVNRTGRNVLNLIQPGRDGPSADVIVQDFPETEVPAGIGQDGQQFYAVARSPMHLDEVSDQLDRPRYRLQRPLFPWLAWAVHPTGGGPGLVWAMAAVGVAALIGGGIATGGLAHRLGGDVRLAALFPLLPGSYVSLRISTADHLALALLVAAVAFVVHDRPAHAAVAAVLAVLAKESMAVPLIGLLLWRRDRATAVVIGAPLVAAGLLALSLRATVEAAERQVIELTWPFDGVASAAQDWLDGDDLWALGIVVTSVILGAAAIRRRGPVDPLGGPILVQLAFSAFLIHNAIGLNFNAARITAPAIVLAVVALLCPRPRLAAG